MPLTLVTLVVTRREFVTDTCLTLVTLVVTRREFVTDTCLTLVTLVCYKARRLSVQYNKFTRITSWKTSKSHFFQQQTEHAQDREVKLSTSAMYGQRGETIHKCYVWTESPHSTLTFSPIPSLAISECESMKSSVRFVRLCGVVLCTVGYPVVAMQCHRPPPRYFQHPFQA
ncbi:hypothetical protein RRG08_017311 [Elysia crispata]|uniref:Uncharacterized protein n=1 Tax=Elysia crispata TaxID=231223 RepID=A0AAE0YRT2_9GAST|nr:hypothetical protein RRG08_017311 [Elysia crispata]